MRYRHYLWLLLLFLAVTVEAHTLSVVNLSGTNITFANTFTFPAGLTVVNLSGSEYSFKYYFNLYTGYILDDGADYQMVLWGELHILSDVDSNDIQSTTNYGAAVAAGFGSGFLGFGFGWILRLAKRTGGSHA
jgi:hypothetical protein